MVSWAAVTGCHPSPAVATFYHNAAPHGRNITVDESFFRDAPMFEKRGAYLTHFLTEPYAMIRWVMNARPFVASGPEGVEFDGPAVVPV